MTSDDLSPSVNADVRIQPGPDGSPWEALNITFGVMGMTLVVPPGGLVALAQQLPALVHQAMELAIESDNQELRALVGTLPADSIPELPQFGKPGNVPNRADRRHNQ